MSMKLRCKLSEDRDQGSLNAVRAVHGASHSKRIVWTPHSEANVGGGSAEMLT